MRMRLKEIVFFAWDKNTNFCGNPAPSISPKGEEMEEIDAEIATPSVLLAWRWVGLLKIVQPQPLLTADIKFKLRKNAHRRLFRTELKIG